MVVPLHENTGAMVPFDLSERWRAEDALRRNAEQQALLLEVTSDLIRASEPGELGRVTFEHISSAFGADICFNYRLDPEGQRLRLVFVRGIPPEPLKAAEDSSIGPEPIFGEETRESGAQATTAERLLARRFGPGSDGETLRLFSRALPARMPKRRGYRWRPARGGPSTDARRMFRDAMRHAGEIVSLRHRQRRLRQRRVVVLIDVSGSMKERAQAHLAFAHALARAADSVEVFTMGTRLTRITRPLRLRNRELAKPVEGDAVEEKAQNLPRTD